MYDGMNICCT